VAEAVSCVEEGRTEKIVDRSSLQLFFPSTALFFHDFLGFLIFLFSTSFLLATRQLPIQV
jgi:hypothetical protein